MKRCTGAMLKTMALQSEPREREVFDFQVLVQTVTGSFPTDARHLDAAKGGDLGRDQAGIDADHAVFELLRDALDVAVVLGKEIGGQAEFGVIGHPYRFFLGLEAQ